MAANGHAAYGSIVDCAWLTLALGPRHVLVRGSQLQGVILLSYL